VPKGCTILAGRPKSGKSWLALDLGLGVATGGAVLGEECTQGDVLYLALEDNRRRMKDRLEMLGCKSWPSNLSFAHTAPTGADIVTWLRNWYERSANPLLIIIDTLSKIRGPAVRGESSYAEDYKVIVPLQEFASETGSRSSSCTTQGRRRPRTPMTR
jgi:RecA-family ATPase